MVRLIFTTIIGLIFTLKVEAKKVEGQIFYKDDTINVTMNIPVFWNQLNFRKLQLKLIYFDESGVKQVLKPEDAEGFRFTYEGEEISMLSKQNTLRLGRIFNTGSRIFLRSEIDGDLKLYKYYDTQNSPGMVSPGGGMTGGTTNVIVIYILQKGDEALKMPNVLGWRKDMINYFDNCPELSEKIEEKEFGKRDMVAIVQFYNMNCR